MMAKILCIWELGNNLGHLAKLKMFIDEGLRRGHRITLAARFLHSISTVVDISTISIVQTPSIRKPAVRKKQISFPDLISHASFSNHDELEVLTRAWQHMFEQERPDLVVYDHAPTALIASLKYDWHKWVIGSGFLIPRYDGNLWGVFPTTPRDEQTMEALIRCELDLLTTVNETLKKLGTEEIESAHHIYTQCNQQLLLTLPDLDHYGPRTDAMYFGLNYSVFPTKPNWPIGTGPKVFAYLNPFDNLHKLVDTIVQAGARLTLYSRGLSGSFITRYRDKITIASEPVNMSIVVQEADYVINNGNHGTVAVSYAHGIPQLCIVTSLEQLILAEKVIELKRGVIGYRDHPNYEALWITLTSLASLAPKQEHLDLIDPVNIEKKIQALFEQI